ncbi:MAG: signal peptidase II [Planctomycetaceae bacterium]|nr:signal peptidase II [Planctomycetaceae bacterium]
MNGVAVMPSSSSVVKPRVGAARLALFVAIVGGGAALDLWSKNKLFAELGPPGMYATPAHDAVYWIWPGYFGLQTSLNEGALFGMGQGMVWVFASLSFVAAGAIFYWLFIAGAASESLLLVALSGISGGIIGNLYDRLGLWWNESYAGYPQHAVRDWILFRYDGWTWPNFNVADMLLVGGAGLLLLHAWRMPSDSATTKRD